MPCIAGIALAMIGLAMVVDISFGKVSAGGVFMVLLAALACSGFIMFSNKCLEYRVPPTFVEYQRTGQYGKRKTKPTLFSRWVSFYAYG